MQFDVRQAVAAVLTIGMFVAMLDMMIGSPLSSSPSSEKEIVVSIISAGEEIVEKPNENYNHTGTFKEKTPKKLWGLPEPLLQPMWSTHLKSAQAKTRGYGLVKLSNGPLYHPMQVADAVIIARVLGATLVLPKIKESAREINGGFDKVYNVKYFITSLKDVVPIVVHLPADLRSMSRTIVKVPYKVTREYIEDKVRPIFHEKMILQMTSIFSTPNSIVKDSSTEEMQAIRCLVAYNALRFHSHVQNIGNQVINSLRKSSGGDRFIAVDLRVDLLEQKGCRQPENSKSKKCFNASDIGFFLKNLGFSSSTPIYLTQSRWDQSLDPLKNIFPNAVTKEQTAIIDQQTLQLDEPQFERAIDLYVCTHSDVFVPAISGIAYVNIAGKRISMGKTQIFVPTQESLKLEASRVLSRFVTKKDHAVYSCFCKAPSITSKIKSKKKTL